MPKQSTARRASDYRLCGFAYTTYLHTWTSKPDTRFAYHGCVPPSDEYGRYRNINLFPISYAGYGLALGTD